MTFRRFDAPASTTPRCRYAPQRYARKNGVAHPIVRRIWLATLLICWGPVSYADYRRWFRVSRETYRRDMRMVRRTGMYIDAYLHGNYRRLFYLWDSELA